MKHIAILTLTLILFSCSTSKQFNQTRLYDNTFLLTEISTDSEYGCSQIKPVEVGGANRNNEPINERRFLNALAGPNCEKVSYCRAGSCCPVKSKNGLFGMVVLDNYRVTWEGAPDTISIYINMYDAGELKAPKGFTIKRLNSSFNGANQMAIK